MKKLVIIFTSIAVIYSCKKDKSIDETCPSQPIPTNIMPLKVGNFWVYEVFNIDTLNNKTSTYRLDTIKIIGKDTVLGKEYFVFNSSPFFKYSKIREGKGELFALNSNNSNSYPDRLIYSYNKDTLNPIKCWTENWTPNCMLKSGNYMVNNVSVTVPLKTFIANNSQEVFIDKFGWPFWNNTRYGDTYFVPNVGIIKFTTFYYSSPDIISFELVEYKIN